MYSCEGVPSLDLLRLPPWPPSPGCTTAHGVGHTSWAALHLHHASPYLTRRSTAQQGSIALGSLWMSIGCSQRGSGALWLASTALGTAREGQGGSGLPCGYHQHHISIPEVPTPSGLLSSLSGMDVSSWSISRYLGRALVAREAGEGAYLFSTIPYAGSGNPLVFP